MRLFTCALRAVHAQAVWAPICCAHQNAFSRCSANPCKSNSIGFEEEFKKEQLVNVINTKCHLCPDQVAIYLLKDWEAADIERLMKV